MNGVDNHIIYWIWLQCCLGTDSKKLRSAIERYVTPENLYSSDESQLRNSGIFSEREIFRLSNKDLAYSEATAEKCDKLGIDIISYKNGFVKRVRKIFANFQFSCGNCNRKVLKTQYIAD